MHFLTFGSQPTKMPQPFNGCKERTMKKSMFAALCALAAAGAWADDPPVQAPPVYQYQKPNQNLCEKCGVVQSVRQEKRKGEGGAVGIVGGAVVGGLLGNQIGGGSGKTLATVGGAVAGGYAGNEVQKHVNSKQVWVTEVRMRDGTVRKFEQEAKPAWAQGQVVRLNNQNQLRIHTKSSSASYPG
jgi:outer membrane lipoprotein SlyB